MKTKRMQSWMEMIPRLCGNEWMVSKGIVSIFFRYFVKMLLSCQWSYRICQIVKAMRRHACTVSVRLWTTIFAPEDPGDVNSPVLFWGEISHPCKIRPMFEGWNSRGLVLKEDHKVRYVTLFMMYNKFDAVDSYEWDKWWFHIESSEVPVYAHAWDIVH